MLYKQSRTSYILLLTIIFWTLIHTIGFDNSLFLIVAHLPEESLLGYFLYAEIMMKSNIDV